MYCQHCGRPVVTAIFVGSLAYHEECCHGPDWRPQRYEAAPIAGITVDDIRKIVREEVAKAIEPLMPIKWVGGPR